MANTIEIIGFIGEHERHFPQTMPSISEGGLNLMRQQNYITGW